MISIKEGAHTHEQPNRGGIVEKKIVRPPGQDFRKSVIQNDHEHVLQRV